MNEKLFNKISLIIFISYVIIPISIFFLLVLFKLDLWGEIYGTYLFLLSIYMLINSKKYEHHFMFHYVKVISGLVIFGVALFIILFIGGFTILSIDGLFDGAIVEFLRPYFR